MTRTRPTPAGITRSSQPVRFIANKLNSGDAAEYQQQSDRVRKDNHLKGWQAAICLEVEITDPSDFTSPVPVRGVKVGRQRDPSGDGDLGAQRARRRAARHSRPDA
ncbi:MAG: hypothetical protein ABI131_06735, partial [Nostocoides sp.]